MRKQKEKAKAMEKERAPAGQQSPQHFSLLELLWW